MKSTGRFFLLLSFLYSALILALGSWWLFLIVKYGAMVESLTGEGQGGRLLKMVKWEGGTFFGLLILLSASLIFLYWKDQKKTKGLQAFYASMTHELKTPLASIRLQGEVLEEELSSLEDPKESQRLKTLSARLIEDTNKMETQMDKILQLSRLEGGGNLHLSTLNLKEVWEKCVERWGQGLEFESNLEKDIKVYGDEMALNLIFRNLFENTKNHSPEKKASLKVTPESSTVSLCYKDQGQFKGDPQRIGQLFYKHNSIKGSGIGLYLIKKLTEGMKGEMTIHPQPAMTITIELLKGQATPV